MNPYLVCKTFQKSFNNFPKWFEEIPFYKRFCIKNNSAISLFIRPLHGTPTTFGKSVNIKMPVLRKDARVMKLIISFGDILKLNRI